MQDNDFDKIFSHKFGQLPGEPYNEGGWSELSRRMDAHDRRRMRWVMPVLLSLIGALAGSNMFWLYEWYRAEQQLQAGNSRTTISQNDTIIHRTVVYQYDTVYQYVTLVQQRGSGTQMRLPAHNPFNAFSPHNISTEIPAAGQNLADGLHPNSKSKNDLQQVAATPPLNVQEQGAQLFTNGDAAAPDHAIVRKTPMDTAELATPPPPSELAPADTTFENLLNDKSLPTKKAPSPFLYFARPRIGVAAMWGIPSFPHKSAGSIFGGGIRADVEIARNFRLGAEVTYQQASLKSDETEILEELDIDIPNPGGDFRLKYWETYFLPAFSYALHLRYDIPLHSNWTPWFGVGGQAITMLPFEIEYEFENEFNDIELHVPAQAESNTHVQGILFMLGAECRLNPHFYFGAEGYLLQHIGEEEEQGLLGRQIGLKTSLYYKF